jgi:hypothetical protein
VYAHLGDDPETVECKRPTAREMLKWVQRSDANMNVFMKRVLTQGLGKGQGPEAAQMEQTEPDDPSDVRLDALLKELEADWAKENDGAK